MRTRILSSLLLAVLLAACGDRASTPAAPLVFKSTDITGVAWGKDFHMTDDHGVARDLASFRGQVVMLYFGYTNCPDMCPTTLAQMAQARSKLGADGKRVQGLFVTVDPERDTREVLSKYVKAFDPTFLGLRGDAATTEALAKEFKVFFKANKPDMADHYMVDHMGGVYVFDPAGNLRLFMSAETGIDAMAGDIATLLKEHV